jgi:predicted glycosyltransferase involved in capsule biosynthesis
MLSLVCCYYDSWKALMWQKENLINSGLDIVIVDDHSPEPLNIEWANVYRMKSDIFFNLDAVNLSVLKAKCDKIFRFDLDHRADYKAISEIEIPEKTIYQFKRLSGDKILPPNPSHILINKDDFIKIGGWNTIYSGHYGMCDRDFIRRAIKMGYNIEIYPIEIEVNPSLNTKNIKRDTSRNKEIFLSNSNCITNWNIEFETINELNKK